MKRALVFGLVAATTAACDPIATGSFRPPFVTIDGVIDGSTEAVKPSDVHVALLWQNDVTPGSSYLVQPVDVRAQFPASFFVDVTTSPPPSVVHSLPSDTPSSTGLDPSMQWALGTIVVYLDDGDGKFTVVGPNDPPSSDKVLAADLDIFDLATGRPAPADFVGIFPVTGGFSLVQEQPQTDPAPGECGRFTAQGHFTDLCGPKLGAWTSIDPAAFTEHLTLVDDPRLQGFTCNTFWGPVEYPDYLLDPTNVCDGGACRFCRGYQCPLDLPGPDDVPTCSADKLSYVYKHCTNDPSLCNTRFCHFGHGELQPGDPIPPGWPCP